ncbi:hypothetical protein STEG23_003913, partial [Scotinomys teguina]
MDALLPGSIRSNNLLLAPHVTVGHGVLSCLPRQILGLTYLHRYPSLKDKNTVGYWKPPL